MTAIPEKYKKLPDETFDQYLDRVSSTAPTPKPKPKPHDWAKALAEERWAQRQRDLPLQMRQQAIDAVWERTLMEKKLQQEEIERTCFTKWPGDPDFGV